MWRLTCNNSMAYLKNWTDNFFQIFFMGTSWVAVSINNITTRASREMTSRKHIKIFYFNGVNVAKHWYVAGEVFAISDCLVGRCGALRKQTNVNKLINSLYLMVSDNNFNRWGTVRQIVYISRSADNFLYCVQQWRVFIRTVNIFVHDRYFYVPQLD